MRSVRIWIVAIVLLSAGVVFVSGWTAARDAVTVVLKDGAGETIGKATLSGIGSGMNVEVEARGLRPGLHAFHIHAIGKCEGPDFATAGGHLNPEKKEHGVMNPNGPHMGDMYNIRADAEGNVRATIISAQVDFDHSDVLFEGEGTALVIHEKEDDLKTDPTGNAGARVACGVIRR